MLRDRETGTAEVNGRRYDMNVLVACNTLYKVSFWPFPNLGIRL